MYLGQVHLELISHEARDLDSVGRAATAPIVEPRRVANDRQVRLDDIADVIIRLICLWQAHMERRHIDPAGGPGQCPMDPDNEAHHQVLVDPGRSGRHVEHLSAGELPTLPIRPAAVIRVGECPRLGIGPESPMGRHGSRSSHWTSGRVRWRDYSPEALQPS
jgi:hypothetical protein